MKFIFKQNHIIYKVHCRYTNTEKVFWFTRTVWFRLANIEYRLPWYRLSNYTRYILWLLLTSVAIYPVFAGDLFFLFFSKSALFNFLSPNLTKIKLRIMDIDSSHLEFRWIIKLLWACDEVGRFQNQVPNTYILRKALTGWYRVVLKWKQISSELR